MSGLQNHPRVRPAARSEARTARPALAGLIATAVAAVLLAAPVRSTAVHAAGPSIVISGAGGVVAGLPVDVGPCPSGEGSDYCFGPDPAYATVGDTVSWLNNSGQPHHLVGSGANTHQSFAATIDGSSGFATITVSDTYTYTDTLHPEVRGSLIVSPLTAGSGAGVAPPTVKPGQSLGQVTGAGAAKPHVVAAGPALGIVTGPPADIGPPGSRELPPVTVTPGADLGSLPPITSPSPSRSATPLAAGNTGDSSGRPGGLYALGAALFAVLVLGGAIFLGIHRWQRHRRDQVPA